MRLLLDEQISGTVADRLREHGHDVRAVTADRVLRRLSDRQVFEVAQREERVVVTYNRGDFEAIVRERAAAGQAHRGLVIVHPIRFPSSQLARLVDALDDQIPRLPRGGSFVVWLQERRPVRS
ncbi:MAG: DUF5615 family PIN-like protein [Solirubrobacterales bacterium]|nr:DUF5615 family PIN-like protein [Solirubrobacterales bacterium]